MICPICTGGSSKEETFTITRLINGLLYKCWRASCSAKGFIGFDKVTQYQDTAPAGKKPHMVFKGDISPCPGETLDTLSSKYEIPIDILEFCNVGWCYDKSRLVLPLYGPYGGHIGVSLRDLTGTQKPKVLSFRDADLPENVPLMGWYVHDGRRDMDSRVVVVVEDQFSAMKLFYLGINAIALIGSEITLAKAMYIQKYFSKAVIFLDFDALDKVRLNLKKVGWLFEYTSILFDEQKRDPKDIPAQELKEKIGKEIERIKDSGSLLLGQEGV